MDKLQVGKIVFFNKGKKLELPLSYSDISSLNSKIKQSLFSKEEAKFLSNFLETQVSEGSAFNAKLYKKLTEQGFSVIRVMPQIKDGSIIEGTNYLTAIISDNVKCEDADNILNYYRSAENSNEDINLQKQVYVFDNGKYYYNGKVEKGKTHNETLRLFLNYKTGRLSSEEDEIMRKYLNFDLQDVFLADTKERLLSHKNEAVILITSKGKIYASTKKKEQHKYEAIEMMKNDIGIDVDDKESEADKLAKDYNIVVIKLYKADSNIAAIFCPEELTEKQIDGLIRCMENFSRINLNLQVEGKNPIVTLVGGNQFLRTDMGESANVEKVLQKMLEYEKSKKNKGLLGTSINWIATSAGNFSKYLEKLKKTLQFPVSDEPGGRE